MAEVFSGERDEARSVMLVGWRLGLWWVLASTIGWAIGGPLGLAMDLSRSIIVAGSLGLAGGGLVAGVMQWLALRRYVTRAGWWVLVGPVGAAIAAVVGVMAGLVAGLSGDAVVSVNVGWVVGSGVFGTVLGVLQWLVLRRQVSRAGWWVLASTLGWVASGPVAGIVDAAVDMAVGWAVLGTVYGAVTGAALVWLLRQPVPSDGP